MFTLQSLPLPVIGAPMAGGPSTPELVAAVGGAGGLAFLAAGYKHPDAVAAEIARTRGLTGAPFGVNLFVPDAANTYAANTYTPASDRTAKLEAALAFRTRLAAAADTGSGLTGSGFTEPDTGPGTTGSLTETGFTERDTGPGTTGPGPGGWGSPEPGPGESGSPEPGYPDPDDDDGWTGKLDLVLRERVPVVSFTFGLPEPAVLAELAGRGICTVVTVTDVDEARAAADAGARLLCVQGPDAGGHRGTLDSAKVPGEVSLSELLRHIGAVCTLPLIAAGGIATADDAAAALSAGAEAVQVGTALLLSPEAGTSPVHRAALQDAAAGRRSPETALTRAFSGRPARGLANGFMRAYPDAPDAYPYVNQITGPLRAAAAAAGNPEGVSLWAGTGYGKASGESAAVIVRSLAGH